MKTFTVIAVFVILIDGLCLSEIKIKTSQLDQCTELEHAAIKILVSCYKNRRNAIFLYGDFSDNVISKLSSRTSYGMVLLDDGKWEQNPRRHARVHIRFEDRRLKFDFIVTMATTYQEIIHMLTRLASFTHANSSASVFVLGWSTKNRCKPYTYEMESILAIFNNNEMHNVNVLTGDLRNGMWIITSSPYGMTAPQSWRSIRGGVDRRYPAIRYYFQKYEKDKQICQNLEFEKTREVGGLPMEIVIVYRAPTKLTDSYTYVNDFVFNKHNARLMKRKFDFIKKFLKSINATILYKVVLTRSGSSEVIVSKRGVTAMRVDWRTYASTGWTCTYPDKEGCIILITQFRGYKSQLEKIYGIVDGYSWIGMMLVNFITLMFLKYFLRQPVMVGLLNLVRLTGNWGLARIPLNFAPRIYMACLLFFVVTMTGIFTGDLAALLTHDIPVRQVNSIEDLADLNYTIHLSRADLIYFEDPVFKNRLRPYEGLGDCIDDVISDPLAACVAADDLVKDRARGYELYISSGCIDIEYACCPITTGWAFEKRLHRFLRIMIETGIRMPFDSMVYHKRTLEAAAIEVPVEPKVMLFEDLRFAFNILAFGLVCASVTLLAELLVDRCFRCCSTSRVIVLK